MDGRGKKMPYQFKRFLKDAISSITRETIKIIGAGRTDARVHAIGQVANFRSNTKIPIEKLPYAINSRLPNDIAVKTRKSHQKIFMLGFRQRARYISTEYTMPHFLRRF